MVSFPMRLILEIDHTIRLPKYNKVSLIKFKNHQRALGGSKIQATALTESDSNVKVELADQQEAAATSMSSMMAKISA